MNEKYCKNYLFTTEIDKRNLATILFLLAYRININVVGMINRYTRQVVTMNDLFDTLPISDSFKYKLSLP